MDKVGAVMAAKERTETQYVDDARVAKEKEAARQQRKREAEREAEPNNMAAIWREIEENRGKLLRLATHQTGCR